MKLDNNTEYI